MIELLLCALSAQSVERVREAEALGLEVAREVEEVEVALQSCGPYLELLDTEALDLLEQSGSHAKDLDP